MATIWLVMKETQTEHGYVDTSVVAAFPTEAGATDARRTYENADLATGEEVAGREDEWTDQTVDPDGNWTVSYRIDQTSLEPAR